ncbi:MAG: class I SAM-dependent DNA methyltransferase [Candidatus Diapherotrites archaeon]|nr:class I SAM-dependent DNA methyltransferase [Candidatus Diapherotrites archaeon]
MTNIEQKLWGFCHILRHDGMNYGDYIDQLTFLLFLKMAEEKGHDIPQQWSWAKLKEKSGTELIEFYQDLLRKLGKEKGILGEIFLEAQSRFNNPVNLKKLIQLIDELEWSSLGIDVKAAAYEGLLEKAASEGKKGAGQFFTPRILIQAIVRVMKPNPLKDKEFTIHDPAAGTGGFLVEAYEWLIEQTNQGAKIPREDWSRLKQKTYSGTELVQQPRRLALMNLYLHGIHDGIYLGDSISEPASEKKYSCILTNPPFGTKGSGQAPHREDFIIETSNKQLNFLQHCMTILKSGGRCAIVLPDNVLFEEHAASQVIKNLMEDCNLHTVMRLPNGTFTPYSQGVKANVLFFTKGVKTEKVWIYDNRTNIEGVTKKDRPLTPEHFAEFEKAFGSDPNGLNQRTPTERFKCFKRKEIEDRNYNLDIFWLKDDSLDDGELETPEEIIKNIRNSQEKIAGYLDEIEKVLNNGN